MITRDFRPYLLSDLAGNDLNRLVVKKVVENRDTFPRTFVFSGEYGTGKTSTARIFARALNCRNFNGEICGECGPCKEDLDYAGFYYEYDSSQLSADSVRQIRDTFYYATGDYSKVVVFDECHLISGVAQSALLKVVEENPEKVFFIFVTTHPDKILNTIRSRSVELSFDTLAHDLVRDNLKQIAAKRGMTLSDKTMSLIVRYSFGHMRNAHMMLDKCLLLGEEDFLKTVKDSRTEILRLFVALSQKNKVAFMAAINNLLTCPLQYLQYEFKEVILDLLKASVGLKDEEILKKAVSVLGQNLLKIVKTYTGEWARSAFTDDLTFQIVHLAMYQMFSGEIY